MTITKSDLELAPFDGADYLDSEETIVEYLTAALENRSEHDTSTGPAFFPSGP